MLQRLQIYSVIVLSISAPFTDGKYNKSLFYLAECRSYWQLVQNFWSLHSVDLFSLVSERSWVWQAFTDMVNWFFTVQTSVLITPFQWPRVPFLNMYSNLLDCTQIAHSKYNSFLVPYLLFTHIHYECQTKCLETT